jgi:hypothetical protein
MEKLAQNLKPEVLDMDPFESFSQQMRAEAPAYTNNINTDLLAGQLLSKLAAGDPVGAAIACMLISQREDGRDVLREHYKDSASHGRAGIRERRRQNKEARAKEQRLSVDSIAVGVECLGKGPKAVIVRLTGIAFNSHTGFRADDKLDLSVSPKSAVLLGGEIDAETMLAWHGTRGGIRLRKTPILDIFNALEAFALWANQFPYASCVFGLSAQDLPLLKGYYQRAGMPCAWASERSRDTLKVFALSHEKGTPVLFNPVGRTEEDTSRLVDALCTALRVTRT